MSWALALGVVLLLAIAGAPLFALIAAVALFGFWLIGLDPTIVAVEFYRLADMPVLLSIPLFTLAGYLLGESQAPKRLVRLTDALLGWLPGGLGVVALLACALFTAFTGASGVTIVALGALLYPALISARYPERFSLGLVTTSGSLGLLFAPSLPLILYAVVAQQLGTTPPVSVDDLFLAGLLPGALMVGLLSIYAMWTAHKSGIVRPTLKRGELRAALYEARYELPLPLIVLGGIYGGLFAASEAAAVTALYVLIVIVGVRREIPLKRLPAVMRESMVMVGAILLILGVSLGLTNFLIDQEIPSQLFDAIQGTVQSKWVFLLLLNLFLLLLGMLLDIFSATVIMVPIIVPIALAYGIDPVHLGIIFLANMQLGYFTPPVGMNLFIASIRFGKPIGELVRACLPFFVILAVAVALITYWPSLSLALVR
jgi:C4-dicarboxylate transporter, DctM subunit